MQICFYVTRRAAPTGNNNIGSTFPELSADLRIQRHIRLSPKTPPEETKNISHLILDVVKISELLGVYRT